MTIIALEFSEDELLIIKKAILHIDIIDYEQILHKIQYNCMMLEILPSKWQLHV